jgi:hypothetical protein
VFLKSRPSTWQHLKVTVLNKLGKSVGEFCPPKTKARKALRRWRWRSVPWRLLSLDIPSWLLRFSVLKEVLRVLTPVMANWIVGNEEFLPQHKLPGKGTMEVSGSLGFFFTGVGEFALVCVCFLFFSILGCWF